MSGSAMRAAVSVPPRIRPRNTGAAIWLALIPPLCVAGGVLAAKAPILVVLVIGAALAGFAFTVWPAAMLLGVLLVRPSLDSSGALISIGGANLAGIVGAATLVGGGLALAIRRPKLPARGTAAVLTAFVLLALASLLWSFNRAEGGRLWVSVAVFAVVFGLARWTVRDMRQFHRMVGVILASAVVPILVGLYQRASGKTVEKEGFESIASTFAHPNLYATFLCLVIVIALVVRFESRNVALRTWLLGGIGLAGVCFVFTFSRSTWLGLGCVLAILAASHYRRMLAVAPLAALIVVIASPASAAQIQQRFSDLSGSSANYSSNSLSWRKENWSRMFGYATDKPLLGYGFGTYLPLTLEEFGRADENHFELDYGGVPSHNDYLLSAVELGVPGALLWLGVFLALMVAVWRVRTAPGLRPYAVATVWLLAVVAVESFVANDRGNGPAFFVLMAMSGGIIGVAHQSRRNALPYGRRASP